VNGILITYKRIIQLASATGEEKCLRAGKGKKIMGDIVCELQKNSREKVVFTLNSFRGKQYLDLRLFVAGENGGPDIPTRKGLTLAVDLYPQFRRALDQVDESLISCGLMDKEDLEVYE
jgi:hypothetical protein